MGYSLMDEFADIEKQTELNAAPTSEADKMEVDYVEREARWLEKRMGKITSSKLPDLMKGGRGKNVEWGETSKKVILAAIHERMTEVPRIHLNLKQFEWGNEYEPEAIQYYAKETKQEVKNCATDGVDIVFLERDDIPGFGDSPDAIVLKESLIKVTVEVKCPESGAVHLEYCGIKDIHEKLEYYWQKLGHLLAAPTADRLDFISYDPRFPDGHPLKIHIVSMYRKDHEDNLTRLHARISDANFIIDRIMKNHDMSEVANIDNIMSQRDMGELPPASETKALTQ